VSALRQFRRLAAVAAVMVTAASAQQASPYFTGDGGKGIRLAVLEPSGNGLSADDQWMLSLVQGSITGDFNKFSGMTIIDRQNLEKVIGEWKEHASGKYSDEDYVRIGNLTNASHILTGNISKTANAFMIEFSVTDLQSGVRKASYSPKPVSLFALENLSAVKEASADILRQLGVNLTGAAIAELKQTENMAKIRAETMLARGITAQKQGTEVAALNYFFEAAILDPSLAEAVNRSSVMAANISSGNIGADARNDILWREAWVARLEEAERYFDHLNKTVSMPYTLFYSDEIVQGDINYQDKTMSLTIKTNLYGSSGIKVWALSVERALQAVYDGLDATKRKEVWGLNNWPNHRVTDLNPFARQRKTFTVVAELVNSGNTVIGREEFQIEGYWEYNTYGGRMGVSVSADGRKDVRFRNVNANDITDNLTIRFASVNGEAAETAAQKGVLQIRPMRKSDFNASDRFTFAFGEIIRYNGAGERLVIPNTLWGDAIISIGNEMFRGKSLSGVTIPSSVTSIGERAFADNALTAVNIPNGVRFIEKGAFANNQIIEVTIPNSVVSIGERAFADNRLTGVIIPDGMTSIENSAFADNRITSVTVPGSVTSIGERAFDGNRVTAVTIGANVTLGRNAFGNGFQEIYQGAGRKAGEYTVYNENGAWTLKRKREEMSETELEALRTRWRGQYFIGGGVSLMMNSIDTVYKYNGGQFTVGLEWLKNNINFIHYGLNFNYCAIGYDGFKSGKMRDDMINFGAYVKLYPAEIVYLSGGAGVGWRYPNKDFTRESVVEPVFSAGAGIIILHVHDKNLDGGGGFILDAQYNMIPLKDRLAGYLSINLTMGGCRSGVPSKPRS